MSYKNKALNSIQYTGKVTLSRYIGEKKVKIAQFDNAGKYSLFNFFSDCLLGDFDIAKNNRPTKIMLLDKKESDTGEKYYESRSGFIYLFNKPIKSYDQSKGIVQYSFHIYQDILESTTFNSIGLYPNSASLVNFDTNFAAVVDNVTTTIKVSGLSVLVVDWELTISNKNAEVN